MSSKKTYHFIAVNFNNSKYTFSFIDSIIAFKESNYNIIIVDNNSEAKDRNQLEIYCAKYPSVLLIKNKKNIGYFPALNVGLKSLKKEDDDFVIIGNNDLTFASEFCIKLNSLLIDKNVLVIAPNLITLDNNHQNPHIIARFNFIKRIYRKV